MAIDHKTGGTADSWVGFAAAVTYDTRGPRTGRIPMPIELATDPPFQHLARQANKLMEQMQRGYYNFCPSETWTPNVNLYETGEVYLVCVDLAGVAKEKIDVEVADGRLKLRGTRSVPRLDEEAEAAEGHRIRVHLMEIDHGGFCREVELPPDAARERITAQYRNGLLWIEIPKN